MEIKERVKRILELLDGQYGAVRKCFLNYETPWQLLVATILSAQCTDACVNSVTPKLFATYPDLKALSEANLSELEKEIHSTGFYRNKAKNIKACAQTLIEKYNSEVPKDIEELVKLPGVGRKTGNVIRTHIYNDPCVVVDTHVKRVSKRLGLTRETDPVKIEFDLMKKVPRDHWMSINHDLILLGRSICFSQKPKCEECFLKEVCKSYSSPERSGRM